MREILTIIAACLVAVLTAALAVPPFIDWDAQRGGIEARLSRELGGAVSITGPVSVRLLPAPRLVLGAMSLDRPGLTLQADAGRFEASATSVLRGRLDFTEAALDHPRIVVTPAEFSADVDQAARVGVERLTLSDAALEIRGAQPMRLDHVDLSAGADSMRGPFRGAGVLNGAQPARFSFSTGSVADGKMRGKLALEIASVGAHAEADGELSVGDGALLFTGNGIVSGVAAGVAPPWRAGFALKAESGRIRAENIEARLGDDDHALTASGEGTLTRDGSLAVRLAARNLDLDRFRGAYPGWTPLALATGSALAATFELSADSATLGGDTIAAPALDLTLSPGVASDSKIDAGLPGRSRMHYEGKIGTGFTLDGAARLSTRDPHALGAWAMPFFPVAGRLLGATPFAAVDIASAVMTANGKTELRIDEARLDRSSFSGTLDWTASHENARARLQAQISSPALDIDGLPDLGALAALGGDFDLSLAVDARAIRIARLGAAAADAGRVRFRARRDAEGLSLDDLDIDNLGGATLKGSARFAARDARADLKLDAKSLVDLGTLLQRVAPGAASEAFKVRAAALSPAHLTFSLQSHGDDSTEISLSGEAGGTTLSAQTRPRGAAGDSTFSARAESFDAAVLFRQLGFAVLPLKGFGAASLEVSGQGAPGEPMKTVARFSGAGAHAEFTGDLVASLERASASGRVALAAGDATPLIQLFGFGAGDVTRRIPVEAKGRLEIGPARLSLLDIAGAVVGAGVAGNLAQGADGGIVGALSLDRLSAPFLASLALGPAQPASADALWPTIRFAPGIFDSPRADLDLQVARVDLGDAIGSDAQAKISVAPGAVRFADLSMRVAGGTVSGSGALRREGATAIAKADLAAEGIALAGGPLSSRVSGRLSFSGAGASAGELVASLAGEGHARFAETSISHAAPGAVADLAASAERDGTSAAQGAFARKLSSGLDAGAQRLEPWEADLSLSNGRLSLTPGVSRAGLASTRVGGGLDLRTGALDLREKLSAPAPQDWNGAPPSIDIVWSGPARAPTRGVQADGLIAAFADRAIARETARNAALEADIRERAFFNRRLKSDRRLDAERRADRAARVEAARAEKARLETERFERESQGIARPGRAPSTFMPAPRGPVPESATAGGR